MGRNNQRNKRIKRRQFKNSPEMREELEQVRLFAKSCSSNNGNIHLIVECQNGMIADYWPTSHRWIVRESHIQGHDFEGFIGFMRNSVVAPADYPPEFIQAREKKRLQLLRMEELSRLRLIIGDRSSS